MNNGVASEGSHILLIFLIIYESKWGGHRVPSPAFGVAMANLIPSLDSHMPIIYSYINSQNNTTIQVIQHISSLILTCTLFFVTLKLYSLKTYKFNLHYATDKIMTVAKVQF